MSKDGASLYRHGEICLGFLHYCLIFNENFERPVLKCCSTYLVRIAFIGTILFLAFDVG